MNAPATTPAIDHRRARIGLACGLAAYAAWGVLPVYFKALDGVAADPDRRAPHRLVAGRAGAAGDRAQGLAARSAPRSRNRQALRDAGDLRDADRGQLAALRLCDQFGPHPRRQPRLLSQPARQHPARPLLPRRSAVAAPVDRGGDRRGRGRGARRGRARHVVDQPDLVLQLRHLRPAAQAGRGRFAQRADGRDDDPGAVRAGLSGVRGQPRRGGVRHDRRATSCCCSPPG